jgi:hypothetical protein
MSVTKRQIVDLDRIGYLDLLYSVQAGSKFSMFIRHISFSFYPPEFSFTNKKHLPNY